MESDDQPLSNEHIHRYVFLRQETRNIGYQRNPTWITEDVFFCEVCLDYQRRRVDTHYRESSMWETHEYNQPR